MELSCDVIGYEDSKWDWCNLIHLLWQLTVVLSSQYTFINLVTFCTTGPSYAPGKYCLSWQISLPSGSFCVLRSVTSGISGPKKNVKQTNQFPEKWYLPTITGHHTIHRVTKCFAVLISEQDGNKQCSLYQAVTGKIYPLKQDLLPPATAWRFTLVK